MTTTMQATSAPTRLQNGHVSRVRESDLDDVRAFLKRSFNLADDASFASRDTLRWKYIDPVDVGLEDAAYVLGSGGRIVAHAGLRVTTFHSPDGARLKVGTIIDWAADRTAPGAGIALYRHMMGQTEATYLIGGTPTTQAVAERLGFRSALRARVHARWVRPLDEFMQRPKTARSALRLLHGVAHVPLDKLASPGNWSALPIDSFDESVTKFLTATPATHSIGERTVAELNHRLKSPLAPMRAYLLERSGRPMGCAIACLGTWNARILAVYGAVTTREDMESVYSLLTADLARDPHVCRVSVLSSVDTTHAALIANGYWVNRVEPVSFYDPSGRASALRPINLQYIDTDIDDYNS